MVLRDIMVCLDGTLAGEGRLELGLNLARASKAYLTAVYCVPELHAPPPLPAGAGLPPTILGPVSPDGATAIGEEPTPVPISAMPILAEAEHADEAEQRFQQELPLREIDGEWRSLDRDDIPELVQLAKSADLVILGQHPANETEGLVWLRPDDVMIEVGRPVLIVPEIGSFEHVGKRVLIAWDGTREANRALHDALPLLGDAERVTVVHIGAQQADLDRDRPWLERIVHHLARHGINAQPEESLHPAMSVQDALLSRAADLAADMIVAGAYHHSPLRESVFGGVSRGLLDHMMVPVLMSH